MKQLNTFAADDLALCRAPGDAVGALVKASDVREPSAADYNLGLAGWLMELANRPRMIVGVDPAKPGGDVTAVALVKSLGATGKAAPAAATHSVCIKAHHYLAGAMNHVGDVLEYEPASRHVPECWLPCDKDGWVTHVPTADSGCPVPSGVKFETLRRSGDVCLFGETPPYAWELGFRHSRTASPGDIVAWRPTGVAA